MPTVKSDLQPTKARALGLSMRTAREDHDLSLRQVATAMGISAPYLVDLELGRRRVSASLASSFYAAIAKLSTKR